ncbi:MAG: type II toxin-antitoxin system PemK/MazF family toxin [Promethearchaeota archaeon]
MLEQYSIFLMNLDPTIGHEIKKTRPCVIISPNEMNKYLKTIIIAPMTTKSHPYPTRVEIIFSKKSGWIVLDQIRTVDRRRCIKKLGSLKGKTILEVKNVLNEMLVE